MVDTLTLVGIVSVVLVLLLFGLVLNKYKPKRIGDFFVALIIKEATLVFIFGIIIASVAAALTASSVVAPGHTGASSEVNPFGRYLSHGLFEFISAVSLILAMHYLSKIITAFSGGLDPKSKWAKGKNFAIYIIAYLAVWVFLMTVGIAFIRLNGYVVAGNLGEVDAYLLYWKTYFTDPIINNQVYDSMSSPMQIIVSTMVGHVICSVAEGVIAIYKLVFEQDQDMLNVLESKTPPKKEENQKNIHEVITERGDKAMGVETKLGSLLHFVGGSAHEKKDDLFSIIRNAKPNEQAAMSGKVIQLHEKVNNYLKNEKSKDTDNSKQKKLIEEIRTQISRSPKQGGFGFTLPF